MTPQHCTEGGTFRTFVVSSCWYLPRELVTLDLPESVRRSLSQHPVSLACCSTSFVTVVVPFFPTGHIVVTHLTVVLSSVQSVLIVATAAWLKVKESIISR